MFEMFSFLPKLRQVALRNSNCVWSSNVWNWTPAFGFSTCYAVNKEFKDAAIRSRSSWLRTSHKKYSSQLDMMSIEEERRVESVSWVIRLANENNYLSWCRNSYIAVVIGATVMIQTEIPFSMDVSTLFFLLGFLNVSYGTGIFCYNCVIEKDKMLYSNFGAVNHCCFAALHLLCWLAAVLLYFGFLVEDPHVCEGHDRKDE